jgi:hypothetical protein
VGTEITLEVGGLTLDWSKNSSGNDHGMLFQEQDRKPTHSDQINYDYCNENNEAMEMSLCTSLREIVPRLELLGFTLYTAEREFEDCSDVWREECLAMEDAEEEAPNVMSFKEFLSFATEHPIKSLDDTFISSIGSESEVQVRGRFGDEAVTKRIPDVSRYDSNAYSERSYFGNLIYFLHPYSVLRILAENVENLDANVIWQYGPLVENGWANESEFVSCARRNQTFMIATEGSSDTHILKHALALVRPEIEDFFRFIDVSDRHPFPGTGNLVKFAEGLVKIDVHNQVVFLFDNDAEGFDAYQRLLNFNLLSNMRAMMLPDLEQFHAFPAHGPEGVINANINKRAAAIECYLDLEQSDYPSAKVVWTNYKKGLDIYQGALEHKESYTKTFFKQTTKTVLAGSYDMSKLHVVLDALVNECISIAKESRSSVRKAHT